MSETIIGEKEIYTLDIIILEEYNEAFKNLYKEYSEEMINSQELWHERPRVYRTDGGLICTDGIKTVRRHVALRKEKITVIVFASSLKHAMLRRIESIERHFKISNVAQAKIYYYLRNVVKIRTTEIAKAINRTNQYIFQRLDIMDYPKELLEACELGLVSFSQARRYYNDLRKMDSVEWVVKKMNILIEQHKHPSPEHLRAVEYNNVKKPPEKPT